MPGDACAECVGQVIIRSCLTGAAIFIESQVITKRATIIRQGHRLQDWFRLPEPLRIFSETNPGMTDNDIRLGAAAIGISALLGILGLMVIVSSWSLWHPAFFWLGGVSFCIAGLAWLKIALAKRRHEAPRTAKGYGPTTADEEEVDEAESPEFDLRDPEPNQTIRWIWADIWMYG